MKSQAAVSPDAGPGNTFKRQGRFRNRRGMRYKQTLMLKANLQSTIISQEKEMHKLKKKIISQEKEIIKLKKKISELDMYDEEYCSCTCCIKFIT